MSDDESGGIEASAGQFGAVDPDSALLLAGAYDATAFASFWRRNHRDVLSFFLRRTFDNEIAADLCAETFARVLVEIRRFDPDRGSARQFLFAVASGELARWQRRRAVSRRSQAKIGMRFVGAPIDPTDQIVASVDAAAFKSILAECLQALSERDRDVVRLRVVEGRGYPEIAEVLGVSVATARTQVSRALARLSRQVERYDTIGSVA